MGSNHFRNRRSAGLRQPSRHRGFTLLEAIVAIVMFTFIVLALSQAFNIGLQASSRSQHRQVDDGSVRAIFDVITRDILAAYPSMRSPVSTFIAGSGGSSSGSRSAGSGDLLTFSALSARLQAPELEAQSGNGTQTTGTNQEVSQPQSDMATVRYNFDASQGLLYRIITALPNSSQSPAQTAPTPDQAIAQNIVNIQFEFWDATQQNWRTDWDFEQQNQIGVVPLSSIDTSAASSSSSTSGTSGSSGSAASQGTANTTATGDTYLPTAVRVTVTLQQSNGQTQDYVTTIPLGVTQTYVDPNQTANVNTTPATTGTAATASTATTP